MTSIELPRTRARRRPRVHGSAILGLVAAIGAALASQLSVPVPAPPMPSAAPMSRAPVGVPLGGPGNLPGSQVRGPLALTDGLVPAGTSVFDDSVPAVARLDPDLLTALRRAADAAGHDGVRFVVNSGWRSARYEEQLFREAVSRYGSAAAAARWVATPSTSPHVSGDAVDLGPAEATSWLAKHGARFGLCQIYRNEPWHYELRPVATHGGCPAMYADPTGDPRIRG